MTFNPKSPNDSSAPRHALPRMRPRCCLRYLTFFGINIKSFPLSTLIDHAYSCFASTAPPPAGLERSRGYSRRRFALLLAEDLAFVNPSLHANHAIRRTRFAKSV